MSQTALSFHLMFSFGLVLIFLAKIWACFVFHLYQYMCASPNIAERDPTGIFDLYYQERLILYLIEITI